MTIASLLIAQYKLLLLLFKITVDLLWQTYRVANNKWREKMFDNHTYIEMNCIGDCVDYVVYDPYVDLNAPRVSSFSVWMVPGSEKNRDNFGRKIKTVD